MNEPLKHCPSCGSPAKRVWDLEEELVRCTNKDGFCHNSLYSVPINEWQNRPLEDALIARIAELEVEIANLKAECNLKVEPTVEYCSKHATELINNLSSAAWCYGYSRSFENYIAKIDAMAALEQYVGGLERREKDLNELLEIVRVIAEYRSSEWTEEAVSAMNALEKFLNEERQ